MVQIPDSFEFDYLDGDIVYGRASVDRLSAFLGEHGLERAMVVTGRNVGTNHEVMDPVTRGLGDRLVQVFDETTAEKSAETVFDGIEAMEECNADVLVGVGGGSSLDITRQISAYAADGRPLSAYREAARENELRGPSVGDSPAPVVVIPTTLSGADISNSGSVAIFDADESPTGETLRLAGSVDPTGMFYDPTLFETTPPSVLAGSAMNGFDNAIETIYARNGRPITDATAVHSLRLFSESLPNLGDSPEMMDRAVIAGILAQFERRISVIHSFGHGVSRHHPVHQGLVHAVMAPHALRYIFNHVDGGRELLATGFGLEEDLSADAQATAVVDAVIEIRDSLGLPTRLRELEGVPEANIPMIAELTLTDSKMSQGPDGLDPTVEEFEALLRDAW